MNIQNEQLLQYLSGYVRYEENDGYLSLYRLTEKQAENFEKRDLSPRQNASSGIFLEFITDGDEISFDYKIAPGARRPSYAMDILVNGMNTHHIIEEIDFKESNFTAKLEDGKKRVTIIFPNLAQMSIKNVHVNGSVEKYTRKLRFLALGDSITQGFRSKHPSLNYVNILAQKLDAYVLNQGVGSDVFLVENIDAQVKKFFNPDFITVAYGTNDWTLDMNVYANAKAFFIKLKEVYGNTPIFAIVPIHRNNIEGVLHNGLTLEEARKEIEKAADETGVIKIDSRNFVPYHEDFYSDKILHPNDLGFAYYGHNLYETLKIKLGDFLNDNQKDC